MDKRVIAKAVNNFLDQVESAYAELELTIGAPPPAETRSLLNTALEAIKNHYQREETA